MSLSLVTTAVEFELAQVVQSRKERESGGLAINAKVEGNVRPAESRTQGTK